MPRNASQFEYKRSCQSINNDQTGYLKGRLFYSDISSCVENNGWASDVFPLSRGVSYQGCPLSPYLFLLCAGILGNAVRNDNEIRGFKVLDTESKISQYADDTTLILDGSESSLSRSLSLLDTFALISGLKVIPPK